MPFFQRKPKEQQALALPDPSRQVILAGQIANEAARKGLFQEEEARLALHTQRRHRADLDLFAAYLKHAGLVVGDLYTTPEAWKGITWGLVKGFVAWQMQQGYAMRSINVRLSTVRVFCTLASKAGMIEEGELTLIRTVQGYRRVEARNIDAAREQTRYGPKKAEPVPLTWKQANALKNEQPDTPQGRRDALLMCLLLDHGLRCGEVAALKVEAISLSTGLLAFYREKVDKSQMHRLTLDTYRAARNYLDQDRMKPPAETNALLLASRKDGLLLRGKKLVHYQNGTSYWEPLRMKTRAIAQRVEELGKQVGVEGLSPHDCRHYWATAAARGGTDLEALKEAGGWSTLEMPLRYVQEQKIANVEVKLAGEGQL